jgi:DNA mismatch endonuclease (patch repair protein)
MSRIRNCNTKPEETVRKYLFSRGLRYLKNDKRYPGKPDIFLPKYKTMIFIHGCFWHKHIGCRYFVQPIANAAFWQEKLEVNRQRDERNIAQLRSEGWNVIVVWECELKIDVRDERLNRLYYEVTKNLTGD